MHKLIIIKFLIDVSAFPKPFNINTELKKDKSTNLNTGNNDNYSL